MFSVGKFNEAMKYYNKSISQDANFEKAWIQKGKACQSLKCNNESIECFRCALEINSTSDLAMNNLALSYESKKEYDRAFSAMSKAVTIDQKNIKNLFKTGQYLQKQGKFKEAIPFFDKALALKDNDVSALEGKAFSLQALGYNNEALEFYDQALELDTKNKYVINNKGLALEALGRFNDSLNAYDRALELDPNFRNAKINKMHVLMSLGRYEDAMVYFLKI